MQQTVRSFDLADLIANLQKDQEAMPSSESPYYVGAGETPLVKETESITLYQPGPPYVCGTGALGSTDTIYCGFWSCA